MASETVNAGRNNEPNISEEVSAEPTTFPEKLYDKVFDFAAKFASTEIGQAAIERTDKMLHVLEQAAKWSLPRPKEQTSKSDERPLPWIPFLFTLSILRSLRIGMSTLSLLVGNSPVSAADMVHFIQTRRRKLRAVKYRGKQVIRMREQSKSKKPRGIIEKLTSLLTLVVCRPGRNHEKTDVKVVVGSAPNEEKANLNTTGEQSKKRPLEKDESDEDEDEELTADQLLEKYAEMSDVDDEDFVPNASLLADDTSATSGSSDDDVENEAAEETPKHDTTNDEVDIRENGNSCEMPKPIENIKKECPENDEAPPSVSVQQDAGAEQSARAIPKDGPKKTPQGSPEVKKEQFNFGEQPANETEQQNGEHHDSTEKKQQNKTYYNNNNSKKHNHHHNQSGNGRYRGKKNR